MSEEKETKKIPDQITRRQFLRNAGIAVGGTAVGSTFFLSACGKEVEVTKTVAGPTQTVTRYICPVCNQEFDSISALKDHYDAMHDGESPVISGKKKITIIVNGKNILLSSIRNGLFSTYYERN